MNNNLFGKELFSFDIPCVSFVNVHQLVCVVVSFLDLSVGCEFALLTHILSAQLQLCYTCVCSCSEQCTVIRDYSHF